MTDTLAPITRLTRDLKQATVTLTEREARYLVDAYYMIQDHRIEAQGQIRSLGRDGEPHDVLSWLFDQHHALETSIKRALATYADSRLEGQWAMSVTGIGPVIASGLLAHIDVSRAPTAGAVWRFAGIGGDQRWHGRGYFREIVQAARQAEPSDWHALLWVTGAVDVRPGMALTQAGLVASPVGFDAASEIVARYGGAADNIEIHGDNLLLACGDPAGAFQEAYPVKLDWDRIVKALSKRPWNARLKVIAWKAGESFVKVQSNDNDVYGRVFATRKTREIELNEEGAFAEQAAAKLERFKIGKSTDAYKWYSQGKLPPAHIHARAKRYAVKLFLAAYHEVAFFVRYNELPPKPYVIEHLGHAHYFGVPNAGLVPGLREAQERQGPRTTL